MNRRDVLMSAVAATPLTSALIAGEPLQDSNNLPLVIVHTQMRLTAEQRQFRQSELSAAGNSAGCRVLFVCGCDGVAIPSATSNAKYGFSEALNGYSVSGFFQTIDELREWFPPTIAKGEQSPVASHVSELDG